MIKPVDFFKALSDPTRFDLVMLVARHQALCVCDLTEQLQLSQPKISRHLALLRQTSILADHRRGQWVYYSLHPDLPTWAHDIIGRLNSESVVADFVPQDCGSNTHD